MKEHPHVCKDSCQKLKQRESDQALAGLGMRGIAAPWVTGCLELAF